MASTLEISDAACATNNAKAKRFIIRLQALDSRLADAATSPELADAVAQVQEKVAPIVDDFVALLSKFAPECCLKQAFRTGTDAEAFGMLYERMDDALAALPGVTFSGDDLAVSRAQDLLDESEDLRQLLSVVKLALRLSSSATPQNQPGAPTADAAGSKGDANVEEVKADTSASAAHAQAAAPNYLQLSKDQLALLQARLIRVQQAGGNAAERTNPVEQLSGAVDTNPCPRKQAVAAANVNGSAADVDGGKGEPLPQVDDAMIGEDASVEGGEGADGGSGKRRRHTFRVSTRPFIIIPQEEISLKKAIGTGAWGEVYRGRWRTADAATGTRGAIDVAIKKLAAGLSPKATKIFVKELEMHAALDHKGIVKVFGACLGRTAMMVLELAKHGDLYEYMHRHPPTGLGMSLDILLQIAEAMEYLHSVGIAHRDLKSLNVLVCERRFNRKKIVVRVADFGLAKVKHGVMTVLNTRAGTFRWMAPEVMRAEVYKSSADIYSFAMVAFEVLTGGNLPFSELTTAQVAYMVPEGVRPKLPDSLPKALRSLVTSCWAEDPTARPSFTRIVAQLREFPELKRYQAEMSELESQAAVQDGKCQLPQSMRSLAPLSPLANLPPASPQPGQTGNLTLVHSQEEAHAGTVLALVAHEDMVFSAGDDQKVKAWRLTADNKLELAGVMTGHRWAVQCLAVIPETPAREAMIASGSRDSSIMIWSTRDRTVVKSLDKHTSGVLALAASSIYLFSAAEDKCIKVWSIPSMSYVSSVKNLSESPVCMAIHNRTLYAGMPSGALLKIEEKTQRDMLVFTRTKHKVTRTMAAHGKHVSGLAVSQGMLCSGSWDQTIRVWDLETNDLRHSIEAQPATDLVLGLVANGSTIYSCSSGGDIKVWDLATGKQLTALAATHSAPVHCLASLNGLLISGSDDKSIKCWK
eukprot:jgi/Mesvir1/12215/Mv00443-RA.1